MDNLSFPSMHGMHTEETHKIHALQQEIMRRAHSAPHLIHDMEWMHSLLLALRPMVHDPHKIDILIKCVELGTLLQKGGTHEPTRHF